MNLIVCLRLLPTDDQSRHLIVTMERFNEAASYAARVGFEAGVSSQINIHRLCYREIREQFALPSQLAVRAIGKAVDAFRRDRYKCPTFKPHGSVTYDERILSFKGIDRVSLTTLEGRQQVAIIYEEYQSQRFDRPKGQVDLVRRHDQFYLYATVDLPGCPVHDIKEFQGIELDLAEDGEPYPRVRSESPAYGLEPQAHGA